MSKINFLALGGLDEKYKSLNILEIDSKMYILDAGIYEPLKNNFGIQSFIPKLDYIVENKDKIKGIFLTTAIYHQIGAIVNILKLIPDIKIYGSRITLNVLHIFFEGFNFSKNFNFLENGKEYEIGGIKVFPIELNSSIPGTFGYIFNSNDGNIFYFNNYAFDSLDEYKIPLFTNLNNFFAKDNLLFISDSLNMEIESSVSPKYKITKYIRNSFSLKRRIIAFIYEEDFINIMELINLAKIYNKKIYFYEEKMLNFLNVVFLETKTKKYEKIYDLKKLKPENTKEALVIITGNKANLYKRIQGIIVENNDEDFNFAKDDEILFAAEPVPGNEHIFQDIVNGLSRYDAKIILPDKGEKFSIHPSRYDLKNFLSILKPKYLIPIRGYYKDFFLAKTMAIESGFPNENVIIIDNGDVIEIENKKLIGKVRKIKNVGSKVIETINDSEIHSTIIEERKQLGKDGIATISFILDKKTKEIISNVDVQMRGVIFIKNQENLMKNIDEIIKKNVLEINENWNLNKLISNINKEVIKLLKATIKKVPIIIIKVKENERK